MMNVPSWKPNAPHAGAGRWAGNKHGGSVMHKFTLAVSASLVIALGACLVVGTSALAAGLTGNIPASRLDGTTYTSPDGGFELTLPPLMAPGAKAEERQLNEWQMGVFFADDLGNVYYVIRTDNTQLKYDLEKVAAGYTINDELREKQIVPTQRGSELRLAEVLRGRSPIVAETKVKRKTTRKNLDLHQASSHFVSDTHIYEVAAGMTATHQESDTEMLSRAKQRLDAFLGALRIKATAPPHN
jgi:hypothetical protein